MSILPWIALSSILTEMRKANATPKGAVNAAAGRGDVLFTDLYELMMLQAYFEENMMEEAVFTLFVRRLPQHRNFLLACGLDTVLDYLATLRFGDDDIAHLSCLGRFSDRFLSWLREFRFTGEVYASRRGRRYLRMSRSSRWSLHSRRRSSSKPSS